VSATKIVRALESINFFSALCGNRVGFPSDEVQALCDEILPPFLLMGEAHSLEASHF
jgi:hypothetical protein